MGRKRLEKEERKTVFVRLPESDYERLVKINNYMAKIKEFIKKLIKGS